MTYDKRRATLFYVPYELLDPLEQDEVDEYRKDEYRDDQDGNDDD